MCEQMFPLIDCPCLFLSAACSFFFSVFFLVRMNAAPEEAVVVRTAKKDSQQVVEARKKVRKKHKLGSIIIIKNKRTARYFFPSPICLSTTVYNASHGREPQGTRKCSETRLMSKELAHHYDGGNDKETTKL